MPADHPPEKRIDPHLSRPPDRPLPGSSRPKETLQAVRRRRGSRPASRSSYAAASRAPTRDHKAGETDASRERFAAHHSHHLHSTVSSNATCERFLGSVRRECLDHIIILGQRHLANVLNEYSFRYFNKSRPHQGIGQRIPSPSASKKFTVGDTIKSIPILAGLHHHYRVVA